MSQPYERGPHIEATEHYALLRHVLSLGPTGMALEFGVGRATSTRIIAKSMPVIGFDSWLGLPENWRPKYGAGAFAYNPPGDIPNVTLVDGWFEDTLPEIYWTSLTFIGLVHIDCDLYSSTKTVLDHIGDFLEPGTYVVFDEFWGYNDGLDASYKDHEYKAWREFAERTQIAWRVIGHCNESWGIQIA